MSKKEAHIDLWLKEIIPSNELRKWFGHDDSKWGKFKKRYKKELKEKNFVRRPLGLEAEKKLF